MERTSAGTLKTGALSQMRHICLIMPPLRAANGQALQRVELALPVTWAAAVAAALLAAVSAAAGAPLVSVRVLGAAAAAAALAALHRGLVWFKSLFIFTDYCHADVH